uniref:Uncharacterized protein n=1 Tax=Rhizophora mucronata TaxID=61149 RepID=A0A2P2LUR5_RHIMU
MNIVHLMASCISETEEFVSFIASSYWGTLEIAVWMGFSYENECGFARPFSI